MGIMKVNDQVFNCWTETQHKAIELLESGVKYVKVFQWNESHEEWGLLQELNLERGIEPKPHFNTWTLAPYYFKNFYSRYKRSDAIIIGTTNREQN